MNRRFEEEFVFDSDIFTRNLWDFEKLKLTRKQFDERMELILNEERDKVDEFVSGECLELEALLNNCYVKEFSITNLCYSDLKNYWGCRKERKEYIKNKELKWKAKQELLYQNIIIENE